MIKNKNLLFVVSKIDKKGNYFFLVITRFFKEADLSALSHVLETITNCFRLENLFFMVSRGWRFLFRVLE